MRIKKLTTLLQGEHNTRMLLLREAQRPNGVNSPRRLGEEAESGKTRPDAELCLYSGRTKATSHETQLSGLAAVLSLSPSVAMAGPLEKPV